MPIKMSERSGKEEKDKIRSIITSMTDEFCSYDVVKEYFSGQEPKTVGKADWQKVYVMVGSILREMEAAGRVKFIRWAESEAPIKKKMYKISG
jgi:hypothetical protein